MLSMLTSMAADGVGVVVKQIIYDKVSNKASTNTSLFDTPSPEYPPTILYKYYFEKEKIS